MSWHNAPDLEKLAATQLGGKYGAQLWGVDKNGTLYTTYQLSPGGNWSDWRGPAWNERSNQSPGPVADVAAAQLEDGRARLWILDMSGRIWSIAQQTTTGVWGNWEGPNWNQIPGNTKLLKIAAARLTSNKTRVWAITEKGFLTSCTTLANSGYSPWLDFPTSGKALSPEGAPWTTISACQQGNGRGALWGIDNKNQLWGMGQLDNDAWPQSWVGPNWLEAPKVRKIAAVEMKNQKGACIWAITDDNKIICNEQAAPGGNYWFGWTAGDFENKLRGTDIAGAVQNNNLGRVWVVGTNNFLTTQGMQLSSPVDWERYWTPPVNQS